jgi:TRAP-type C4-dicarboxylate transport system substrate-binding protein
MVLVFMPACAKPEPTPAKPIEMTYSFFVPPIHHAYVLGEAWAREVEKRTDGRVKITTYSGETLLKAADTYDGVVKHIADMGFTCLAYTPGRFPLMEVIDLPLGYPSGTIATMVTNDFYNKFKPAELADTKLLYFHAHGPGILHSKKPIRKLEDIKGLKIRCTGLAAKVVEAMGGVPVAMPNSETYDALAKGVVEASFSPWEVLKTFKQVEVVDYTTNCYAIGYTTVMWHGMNLEVWNSLPKDIQEVIDEVSAEWIAKHGAAWDEVDAEARELTLAEGNEIIELSAEENARWAAAARPVWDATVAGIEGKGLPGEEALDFALEAIKKYSK